MMNSRVLLLPLLLSLSACQSSKQEYKWAGETMGTAYHITLVHKALSVKELQKIKTLIQDHLNYLDHQLFSTYKTNSEISQINRHQSTKSFPVSRKTLDVIEFAHRIAKDSQGAFDPTVAPLVQLWGFGAKAKKKSIPTVKSIQKALESVNYRHIKWLRETSTITKGIDSLKLDLSAVAKGFGADEVAHILGEKGIKNYFVEIGGDVVARGKNSKGEAWRVGIDEPKAGQAAGESISHVVSLNNNALATSGNYRNFFDKNGARYSHLIDPRTGFPVKHNLASATVIAPSCIEADAAATALMVMGPKRGMAWIEKNPHWEALLIVRGQDGKFKTLSSSGF